MVSLNEFDAGLSEMPINMLYLTLKIFFFFHDVGGLSMNL